MTTSINHEPLLAKVLGFAENHPIDPIMVADQFDVNPRYARELLGVLVNLGALGILEEDGEDVWGITQVGRDRLTVKLDTTSSNGVKSNMKGTETEPARKRKERKMSVKTEAAASQLDTSVCHCGCGLAVSKKALFRPGHDARMVSQLVALVVGASNAGFGRAPEAFTDADTTFAKSTEDIQARINKTTQAVAHWYGAPLASKFDSAAMSAWAKYDKPVKVRAPKAPKASKAKVDESNWVDNGTVRVGRWDYPAQEFNGQSRRNTKRDGSGEWVAI